ncbi:MAG: MAPEG family protein [Gammaproteobacteria bacterium]|nr:MAPEG family protein [Gammaproteobacteria bacterium]MDH4311905.1 MAPEG family protein [Gammaproteobacteria bacterium]MDH5272473.1 MAPEG family protein [Gammaproteobacteria bacterium]
MTIAFWCVLVAGFLPYFGTLTAKVGGDSFDNRNPRDWLNAQSGFRKRANAAQHNSFEAFPFFAAAVIIAHVAGAPQGRIDLFAVVFILARLFYIAFYVADMATLRSLAWFVGIGSVVALFLAVA